MHPYKIQDFRGGKAVVFYSNQKRHRIQLSAADDATMHAEAAEKVRAFFRKSEDEITVRDIFEEYSYFLGDRPAGIRLRNSKAIQEYFGGLKPRQITREVVNSYTLQRVHRKTGEPVGDETLWTELGLLRDAINFGVKEKLIAPNDRPTIPRPAKPQPRDRKLSRDEVAKLLYAARDTPHLFIALLLLLGTAGRVTAILELTWDRVDFGSNVIDLRLSSTGPRKGRAKVPMNPGLRSALLKWKSECGAMADSKGTVLHYKGRPIKSLRTAFTKAVRRAGLKNVRQHDLRHTAAVWMLESGSSIQRISQYLGHSSLEQTFKVYARYQPDFLRPEAEALDVSALLVDHCNLKGHFFDEGAPPPVRWRSTNDDFSIIFDRRSNSEFVSFMEVRAQQIIDSFWQEFLTRC